MVATPAAPISEPPSAAAERARALKELRVIPGVGASIAQDLWELGVRRVADLRGRDPEALYRRLCELQGPTDRCMLYVLRCAVYFASHERHDPDKLLWWRWKDPRPVSRGRR